jgi:hypothetical protein
MCLRVQSYSIKEVLLMRGFPARSDGLGRSLFSRLSSIIGRGRVKLGALARRIKRLGAEGLFWVAFALITVIYLFLLITQATGAGRGGR